MSTSHVCVSLVVLLVMVIKEKDSSDIGTMALFVDPGKYFTLLSCQGKGKRILSGWLGEIMWVCMREWGWEEWVQGGEGEGEAVERETAKIRDEGVYVRKSRIRWLDMMEKSQSFKWIVCVSQKRKRQEWETAEHTGSLLRARPCTDSVCDVFVCLCGMCVCFSACYFFFSLKDRNTHLQTLYYSLRYFHTSYFYWFVKQNLQVSLKENEVK